MLIIIVHLTCEMVTIELQRNQSNHNQPIVQKNTIVLRNHLLLSSYEKIMRESRFFLTGTVEFGYNAIVRNRKKALQTNFRYNRILLYLGFLNSGLTAWVWVRKQMY